MIVLGTFLIYAGVYLIDVAEGGEYGLALCGAVLIAGGMAQVYIAGRWSR